jgi:glycosyltransferase involved in cell wall biosynthesis
VIDINNPNFGDTPISSKRPPISYGIFHYDDNPILTIITPFFNVGSVFHETAKCVFQQTLQQWEWLIVNDGSTDADSLALLDQFRSIDPRIHVIDHDTNKGLSAARNTGFMIAHTEYVLLLDGDDLIEPTTAEKWLWFLITHTEYSFVNSYSIGFGAKQYLYNNGFHTNTSIVAENYLTYSCLSRKSVHTTVGGYDETIRKGGEDWEYWVRCANKAYWGYTIPEYLFWYRTRENPSDRWPNLKPNGLTQFARTLSRKYPQLLSKSFPIVKIKSHSSITSLPSMIPFQNNLSRTANRKRVVFIVPWMTMGGTDKFNLDLIQQLRNRGWEITIATTLDHPSIHWDSEFSHFTSDIFVLPRFMKCSDQPRFLHYLISSRQPDVVMISNSELGYLALRYLRNNNPNTTFVDICHSEAPDWKQGGYPRFSIDYQKYLDNTIVTTAYLKNWMIDRGANALKIDVCHTNIDASYWKPDLPVREKVRKNLLPSDQTTLILFVGRISAEKQPLVFAKVVQKLKESGDDFLAIVAGDGEERHLLESYVKKHRLSSHVKLLGSMPSDKVRELMVGADIFFLPSKSEGIALTIFEAMACAVAVVGANVGGQSELVEDGTGILIVTGDEEKEITEYTRTLSMLIRNPEMRRTMGGNARARIEAHFQLDNMGKRMIEIIEKTSYSHSPHSNGTSEINLLDSPDLLEYVNSYTPPDYFGVGNVSLTRQIANLSRRARAYYRDNGFRPTVRMTCHYLAANRYAFLEYFKSIFRR